MQHSKWKAAAKMIDSIQKQACEITNQLSTGSGSANVSEQLKQMNRRIEDMSASCSFSPQQAGMLREISNVISTQLDMIPAQVKEALASDFEKLECCVDELRLAHERSHGEIVILLERLIGMQGVAESHAHQQLLNPLIKVHSDLMLTDQFVGAGGCGEVFIGKYQGSEVAVKVVGHNNLVREKDALENEVLLMSLCHHPSVLPVYGIVHLNGKTLIGMELATRGSLAKLIFDKSNFPYIPLSLSVWLMIDVARAVAHIHSVCVIHRDIKPENILLKDGLRVNLCDFGIAKEKRNSALGTKTNASGTLEYLAPERKNNRGGNHRSDVYSEMVTLLAILTRRTPPPDRDLQEWAEDVACDLPAEVSDLFQILFTEGLEHEIDKRISAKDALFYLLAIGEKLGGDPRGASCMGHVDRSDVLEIDSTARMLFEQSISVAVGKKGNFISPSEGKAK